MLKFIFGIFIVVCVIIVSSQVIAHCFPSSTKTAFEVGGHPVTWVLIFACAMGVIAYRSLSK